MNMKIFHKCVQNIITKYVEKTNIFYYFLGGNNSIFKPSISILTEKLPTRVSFCWTA